MVRVDNTQQPADGRPNIPEEKQGGLEGREVTQQKGNKSLESLASTAKKATEPVAQQKVTAGKNEPDAAKIKKKFVVVKEGDKEILKHHSALSVGDKIAYKLGLKKSDISQDKMEVARTILEVREALKEGNIKKARDIFNANTKDHKAIISALSDKDLQRLSTRLHSDTVNEVAGKLEGAMPLAEAQAEQDLKRLQDSNAKVEKIAEKSMPAPSPAATQKTEAASKPKITRSYSARLKTIGTRLQKVQEKSLTAPQPIRETQASASTQKVQRPFDTIKTNLQHVGQQLLEEKEVKAHAKQFIVVQKGDALVLKHYAAVQGGEKQVPSMRQLFDKSNPGLSEKIVRFSLSVEKGRAADVQEILKKTSGNELNQLMQALPHSAFAKLNALLPPLQKGGKDPYMMARAFLHGKIKPQAPLPPLPPSALKREEPAEEVREIRTATQQPVKPVDKPAVREKALTKTRHVQAELGKVLQNFPMLNHLASKHLVSSTRMTNDEAIEFRKECGKVDIMQQLEVIPKLHELLRKMDPKLTKERAVIEQILVDIQTRTI